jgi:3-hydroxyisobutyrate dehydrogenase
MKIGFIGLGNMGAPMAHNLLKGGHSLNVFDLNAQVVQELVDAGAKATESPRAAVTGVECVITMLPAPAHVRSVLTAENGVLAGISKGVIIIDSSTTIPRAPRPLPNSPHSRVAFLLTRRSRAAPAAPQRAP